MPVPRAVSLIALNEQLLEGCRRRLGDRLRGHDETIGERLVRDLEAFHALPPAPYDACEKKAGRVSSQLLVRYRGTDYSVPTAFGHREVLIRGYVHEVVISCGAEVIARHPRSYEREDFVFDPLHYLPLLEQKIGALDQAAPLVGWDLPEEFATLRRLIEARMAKRGNASSSRCCGCWRYSAPRTCWPVSERPSRVARSALTRSSIWCCAGSSAGRRGST